MKRLVWLAFAHVLLVFAPGKAHGFQSTILAPGNFTGTAVSSTSIQWSWNAVLGSSTTLGATHYELQDQNNAPIAEIPGPGTTPVSFTETGLSPDTQYTRHVVAVNGPYVSPPSNSVSVLTQQATVEDKIKNAFTTAGVTVTKINVNPIPAEPENLITTFDFTGVVIFVQQMRAVRAAVGTSDTTVNGIRVVMGSTGAPGAAGGDPATRDGGVGVAITLKLGNGNLLIALAGDGGPGGAGGTTLGKIKGGAGGKGGKCDISCDDNNSIFSISGYGGTGGAGGALAAGRRTIAGSGGKGGDGGNDKVRFRMCNQINILGGDGGTGGFQIIPGLGGGGGDGGDAHAVAVGTQNTVNLEAGAGGSGGHVGGIDGTNGSTIPKVLPPGFSVTPPTLNY